MQKIFSNVITGLLLFICITANARAPARANALFEDSVASPTVPGISVAIAGEEGIIWAEGFGWADLENKVPMSTKT